MCGLIVRCCAEVVKRRKCFVLKVRQKLLEKVLMQMPKDVKALSAQGSNSHSVFLTDW